MMHSVSVNHCPSYISQLVNNLSQCHNSYAKVSAKYVVQRTRTKFAERAFSVAGPSLWNSLPEDLRLETGTAVVKQKVTSYLFRSAFIPNSSVRLESEIFR